MRKRKIHIFGNERTLCGREFRNLKGTKSSLAHKTANKNICRSCFNIYKREIKFSENYNKLITIYYEELQKNIPEVNNFAIINSSCYACHSCLIDIISTTSEEINETINGILKPRDENFCFNCGNMSNRINAIIPIEKNEFRCPNCNKPLKLRKFDIEKTDIGFLFAISLECPECKQKTERQIVI